MNYRAIAVLVLAGCASAPPPPPLPTTVPRGAIESMCGLLKAEGMTSEVRVIRTTQQIITEASIQALADRAFSSKRSSSPEVASDQPLPVEIPSGSCIARAIDSFNATRDADVMLLQLSAPFHNPFAGNQPGVLARLSLANEAATWYWIPLAQRNDRWIAGPPLMLAVR